jgi:4'-phosphopantetheinyl transferase
VILTADEVHVWVASLPGQRHRRANLERSLSVDEQERAGAYLVPEAAERFVLARGLLREVLGRYAGVPPEQLRFAYPCVCGRDDCAPSQRKPRLEGAGPIRFNLSHADGVAIVAVASDREVGIDVERIDPSARLEAIAQRVLTAPELERLRALPARRQVEAFYELWTRKEAHGKARGTGIDGSAGGSGGWSFHDVPAPDGYVAALAVEGDGCVVRTADWPTEARARREGPEPAA